MNLGPLEIGIIVLLILVLFGYKKLPAASRSLGQSLRIFKGEMKGMKSDDAATRDGGQPAPTRGELTAQPSPSADLTAPLPEDSRTADRRAGDDQSRAVDGPR